MSTPPSGDESSRGERRQRTVELPERLASRVGQRVSRTRFDSVDEYVAFVLEETLARVEAESDESDAVDVDEAEIRDRLESLGYVDS